MTTSEIIQKWLSNTHTQIDFPSRLEKCGEIIIQNKSEFFHGTLVSLIESGMTNVTDSYDDDRGKSIGFFGLHFTSYILAISITCLLIINKIIGWMCVSFDDIS